MQEMKVATINEDMLLWRAIRLGDKKAFEKIFSKYYFILYSYCQYYVSDEDAEEIVQDIMMWLWEKKEEFNPEGSMQYYLITSAKNKCLSFLRKQNVEISSDDFVFVELNSFYENTDFCVVKELEAEIEKAIAELPEAYRIAFKMSRFQNKTRQEIADELGVSIKTIDYRIQNALSELRIKLKDYLPIITILYKIM